MSYDPNLLTVDSDGLPHKRMAIEIVFLMSPGFSLTRCELASRTARLLFRHGVPRVVFSRDWRN